MTYMVPAHAQTVSDPIDISLLTCGPGSDLYTIFGHSAIRVKDRRHGIDIIYNYGTFDFDEPGFLTKFLRGKLNYQLAVQRYDRFILSYQLQKRDVYEQMVAFTPAQEEQVIQFLQENYLPENRDYLYDFFHDNCATRIRDVFEDRSGGQFLVPEGDVRDLSFRQGLDQFDQQWPWTDFGMDLILGLPADRKMSFRSEMYLPTYLASNLSEMIINQNGTATLFLGSPKTLLSFGSSDGRSLAWPLIVFSLLFMAVLISQLMVRSDGVHRWIDILLFFILGIVGCIMAFMWLGTDHVACGYNLNILWANPLYLLLLHPILKKSKIKWPFISILIVSVILLVSWRLLPQQIHPAVLPIIGLVVLRCLYRLRNQMVLPRIRRA